MNVLVNSHPALIAVPSAILQLFNPVAFVWVRTLDFLELAPVCLHPTVIIIAFNVLDVVNYLIKIQLIFWAVLTMRLTRILLLVKWNR